MNGLIRTLLAAVCLTVPSGPAAVAAPGGQGGPADGAGDTLVLPGDDFYPESIIAGPDGTLRVSSLVTGEIVRFRPGSETAETFVPADVNVGTGVALVDGIAFDGRSSIYTTNNDTGRLLRVDIAADGSARTPVEIVPGRRLVAPDGIRVIGPTRLLVTEPGTSSPLLVGVVMRTTTVVAEGLDDPTSVAVAPARGTWVAEGQVMSLSRGEPPTPPFVIRRV